jgi:putative DNA primase/helicase
MEHPYLIKKNITKGLDIKQIASKEIEKFLGHPLKAKGNKLSGDLLVIPIREGSTIVTLQFIDAEGLKLFLPGRGSLKKGVWSTQSLPVSEHFDGTILLGEGIAALSSSRLVTVGEQCREDYPNAKIIFLADLKQNTNLPIEAVVNATTKTDGFLAIPVFSEDNGFTDFNEMLKIEGYNAVKKAIDGAKKIRARQLNESGTKVETICAAEIASENISWLWDGWLASGKIHILGGAPGTGKTTLCMDLAAIISRGGFWPDGTKSILGNVIIWSGEDGLGDTLIPRLNKADALLSNIHFITGITKGNKRRSFDPALDMELLQEKIEEIGNVKLLVIDPIVSAVSGDSHKNAEVRRSLQPLADLAIRFGIALIGVTHFTKGTVGRDPVERITGSLAFGALARVVLIAAKSQHKNENGSTGRVFIRAKSNIGSDEDGFEYELQQGSLKDNPNISTAHIVWGEKIEGTAQQLLADIEFAQNGSKLEEAQNFLINLLKEKPLPQQDIKNESKIANISWATVRRAKQALGVEAFKNGNEHWLWKLRCSK